MANDETKTPREAAQEDREEGEVRANDQAKLPGESSAGNAGGGGNGDTTAPGDGPSGGADSGSTGGTTAPGAGPSGGA